MYKDVSKLVGRCSSCQFGKGNSQNTGLYMPLLVPEAPWVHLSMAFVLGLPKTAKSKPSIRERRKKDQVKSWKWVPIAPRQGLTMPLGCSKPLPGYDFILVVVDRFSKMAHLIPHSKLSVVTHIAKLFFREVARLHGISTSIVSD